MFQLWFCCCLTVSALKMGWGLGGLSNNKNYFVIFVGEVIRSLCRRRIPTQIFVTYVRCRFILRNFRFLPLFPPSLLLSFFWIKMFLFLYLFVNLCSLVQLLPGRLVLAFLHALLVVALFYLLHADIRLGKERRKESLGHNILYMFRLIVPVRRRFSWLLHWCFILCFLGLPTTWPMPLTGSLKGWSLSSLRSLIIKL